MQRVRGRAFKAKLRVPLPCSLVDRMDNQGTDPDLLAGPEDSCHRVRDQRASEMLASVSSVTTRAAWTTKSVSG